MKKRAFSLIEVALAATLASVLFTLLLSLYPSSLRAQTQARQRLLASDILEGLLDQCAAKPLTELLSGNAAQTWTPTSSGPLQEAFKLIPNDDGLSWQSQVTVETRQKDPKNRIILVLVKAEISWKQGDVRRKMEREQWLSSAGR